MRNAVALLSFACMIHMNAPARADGPEGLAHIRDDEPAISWTPASGSSSLSISPRATLQVRAGAPFADQPRSLARGDLVTDAGISLRRVRVGLDATLTPTLTAHVSAEPVNDSLTTATKPPVHLAYANLDLRIFQLRAGFVRVPFTRHSVVDETRQVFLEAPNAWRSDRNAIGRAWVPSALPDRRVGAMMHEDYGILGFHVGAYSGGTLATEPITSALLSARLEITPWMGPPAEGAFFQGDFEADSPRLALSLGGLARTGLAGDTRATSAAVALSYRGLFVSAEGVYGSGHTDGLAPDVRQRALVGELAYRFPWALQGVELGVRGDAWSVSRDFGDGSSELRSLSAVANLYVWRHRVKTSMLVRATKALAAAGVERDRQEGLFDLTVGF